MDTYQHDIGDYAKYAGAFSMLEHGAFLKLRDRYFATEGAIPEDAVYRQVGARSEDERAAVDSVLAEFFRLENGAWRCDQFDVVIEKHLAKGAKAGKAQKSELVSLADLIAEGVEPQVAQDWFTTRRSKGAHSLTRTAWGTVKREAALAGLSPAQAVRVAAENSWQGFKASWLQRDSGARTPHDIFAGAR